MVIQNYRLVLRASRLISDHHPFLQRVGHEEGRPPRPFPHEPTHDLDDTAAYSHLDQNTAELWAEQDALNRRPDPSRPEPDHLMDVDDEI